MNRVIMVDSYKSGQKDQMPPNMTSMFSYGGTRGTNRDYEESFLFGLQGFHLKYFSTPIEAWEVEEAKEFFDDSNEPFPYEGWMKVVNEHKGRLPIRVRAVPEGLAIPLGLPLFTVESTDEELRWLPDWLETAYCRSGWYGGTVLGQSYAICQDIYAALVKTSDDPDSEIGFKLHDFGARGASSSETAGIGGAAHLAVFRGSDTIEGIKYIKDYFGDWKGVRISIPASQHSTITAWGKNSEVNAFRNMLNLYKEKGIFACVSDSWDIYNACSKLWGEELKQEVIDSGALVVIRPDSGDPIKVLFGYRVLNCEESCISAWYCGEDVYNNGDKYYEIEARYSHGEFIGYTKGKEISLTEDQVKGVFNILGEKFGTKANTKGYKVLNYVRVIQGDGINPKSIKAILERLIEDGWSATNLAFGMGGALLQKVDRDVNKFAYKCSSVVVDGEERDVYKDPVTDAGKKSLKGRLDIVNSPEGIVVARLNDGEISHADTIMVKVFENGEVLNKTTFHEVMDRVLTSRRDSATVGK